jgi:hypothetical protein
MGCILEQYVQGQTTQDDVKRAMWQQLYECPTQRNQWTKYENSCFVAYPEKTIITNPNSIFLFLISADVQEA